MARPDAIVVELFGLPGVGKSTMSRHLARELESRGVPVHQPSYGLAHGPGRFARVCMKSTHVVRELLLHPIATVRAARLVAASGQPSGKRCAMLLFNWLLVVSLGRRAGRVPGIHVFDQGLAQGAWSIALEGRVEAALALLQRLPRGAIVPDLLAIVEASHAAVDRRLQARPEADSRLDRRLKSEPELLERSAHVLGRIREVLASTGAPDRPRGLRIVEVANESSEDLPRSAGQLAAELEAVAREAGLGGERVAGAV